MNTPSEQLRVWPGSALALLVAAVLVCVAASSSWLWLVVQQNRIDALRDARFAFSAINVKSALDARLQLGGNVADLGNAKALLAQSFAALSSVISHVDGKTPINVSLSCCFGGLNW